MINRSFTKKMSENLFKNKSKKTERKKKQQRQNSQKKMKKQRENSSKKKKTNRQEQKGGKPPEHHTLACASKDMPPKMPLKCPQTSFLHRLDTLCGVGKLSGGV